MKPIKRTEEEHFMDPGDYTLPPLDLLEGAIEHPAISGEDLDNWVEILERTLSSFDIECKVSDIVSGPTVTRFEVISAFGVKIASIVQRQEDIALNMKARSVRIEAPIPGKDAVAIDVPNPDPQIVTFKEVLASDAFQAIGKKSPLAVCLGKDISGTPAVLDLRTLPHLLITGAAGSGKSVLINSIVNSLIISSSPAEVKMLMVDPKFIELKRYDDIPHLLAPVVTDARKAPRALTWAVEEMERRSQLLARAGVCDIEEYNSMVDLVDKPPEPKTEEGNLPCIVVIVDEFGDLMMVAKKRCEEAVIQIAQKGRALGIHLIIATQRPSVNIITGVIKASLPSRIAFLVGSKVDSRTVLASIGAERLLGQGDMLFKSAHKPKPIRLQGCYISGLEIKKIIKHYADQGPAERTVNLEEDIVMEPVERSTDEDDPLLIAAMKIALEDEDGTISISRIRRLLRIGHPRAAYLVDILQSKSLVGPCDGSKPRKVLFDEEILIRYLRENG